MRIRKVVKGKGLENYITGQVGKYQFQAGLLQNKPHYEPLETLIGYSNKLPVYQKHWYSFAGKKLLRHGNKPDGTLWKIGQEMDEVFMWLRKPFRLPKNADLLAVIDFIVDNLNGKENQQRILNAIQAVIRNPILRKDYGDNSQKTAKEKGFNQLLMATGQLFKNIKVRFLRNVQK